MTVDVPIQSPPVSGRDRACRCADRGDHHDRLLRVETDADELMDLLELAVTWRELDYSATPVVPPARWFDFALDHEWRDPDRMQRLFGLATDIALRAAPVSGTSGLLH